MKHILKDVVKHTHDLGFIEEQMYLSNKKYDELLGIFYNQLEEEIAESESQN